MVTKKRGFDIASLVEGDNDCESIPKKKFHASSIAEHFSNTFNPASIFSGHPPASSSLFVAPPSHHHLLNLTTSSNNNNNNNNIINNNNNNNNQHFPSAFKKVDRRVKNMSPPASLLDLSFNPGSSSSSPVTSRSADIATPTLPTTSSNGRPGSVATPSLLPYLPPSLAALSFPQTNWCAKCNATFRMTSDLVYHMRSHHKPSSSTDPIRKKREEKLRCNICGETFRERHHLTRHMTSHQ